MDELDDPGASPAAANVTFDAGVPVITLTGEIDMSNVDSLRAVILPVVERAPKRVIFDVGALDFMDSSGIALLLNAAAIAEQVQLRRPSAIVRRMIEVTGLSDVLHFEP